MRIKIKSWLWNLTIFAGQNNATTIGNTIYMMKDFNSLSEENKQSLMAHESIHINQQAKVGLLKFMFLYFFCLPLFRNPWRYKWEYEAYKNGSKWQDADIQSELRSWNYGWLQNKENL